MFKAIAALHSALRTILLLMLTGFLGYGGFLGYQTFHAKDLALREKQAELESSQAENERLTQELQEKQRKIERLDTALRLLKVDRRIAHIVVRKKWQPEDTERVMTEFAFVEVDEEGRALERPRTFTIQGDVVYIDFWVAKFQDKYVEGGEELDPLRSTSICLFRRIFGEYQEPNEGEVLDPIGSRPVAYSRGSEMTQLEREIWKNFWEYANDPAKAEAVGLRAAHGEAPSIQLRADKLYKIFLRASDGLSIVPEDLPAVLSSQAL